MPSEAPELPRLAFIGGTGPEGRGLALRFAALNHSVIIGSRSSERAQRAAEDLRTLLPDARIEGRANPDAADLAEIVILTIPYGAIADTLPPLRAATAEKIVVSAIAPVEFQDGRPVALRVPGGSAAEEAQALLPDARLVSA